MTLFTEEIGFIGGDEIDGALAFLGTIRITDEAMVLRQSAQPEFVESMAQAALQQGLFRQGQVQSDVLLEQLLEQQHLLVAYLCLRHRTGNSGCRSGWACSAVAHAFPAFQVAGTDHVPTPFPLLPTIPARRPAHAPHARCRRPPARS